MKTLIRHGMPITDHWVAKPEYRRSGERELGQRIRDDQEQGRGSVEEIDHHSGHRDQHRRDHPDEEEKLATALLEGDPDVHREWFSRAIDDENLHYRGRIAREHGIHPLMLGANLPKREEPHDASLQRRTRRASPRRHAEIARRPSAHAPRVVQNYGYAATEREPSSQMTLK